MSQDRSVDQAISLLGRNQELLSKQITQVVNQQQIQKLNVAFNNELANINTKLAAHQASIDQLDARIAMNPIPSFADGEIPSGAINGINPIFVLAHTPVTGSLRIYAGATATAYGNLALQSVHFTVVGPQITFQAGFIPVTGSWLRAYYRY